MKILVIEDKEIHQRSAEETLSDHEVTIVESFDEAMNLMKEMEAFPFEAVLTDMMMPMSDKTLGPGVYKHGEQVPYGFIIALRAALCGAKYVAMVTDANHHQGAMSAALDQLGPMYYQWPHASEYEDYRPKMFNINGAKVVFVHTPFIVRQKDEVCEQCEAGVKMSQDSCGRCDGTGHEGEQTELKDWGKVLADLTKK